VGRACPLALRVGLIGRFVDFGSCSISSLSAGGFSGLPSHFTLDDVSQPAVAVSFKHHYLETKR
jgi:hypothetical protein